MNRLAGYCKAGAVRSHKNRAQYFAETWVISDKTGSEFRSDALIQLDYRIAESLRCRNGRFSTACGELRWEDFFDESHRRRHVLSHLPQEPRDSKAAIVEAYFIIDAYIDCADSRFLAPCNQ
jgi:hypothetical protein